MVDTNHFAGTVAELTKNPDAEPVRHACDDPDLTALEFLLAVMRDPTFSLAIRMDAASRAAPYFTPRAGETRYYPCVGHRIEYIIPDSPALREGHEPRSPDTEAPEQINENSQSFSHSASNNHHPHDDDPGPPKLMETTFPPLTYDDIQQIKAVVQRHCPDADLSQIPDHLTLCACGHWMPWPCKCVSVH